MYVIIIHFTSKWRHIHNCTIKEKNENSNLLIKSTMSPLLIFSKQKVSVQFLTFDRQIFDVNSRKQKKR